MLGGAFATPQSDARFFGFIIYRSYFSSLKVINYVPNFKSSL